METKETGRGGGEAGPCVAVGVEVTHIEAEEKMVFEISGQSNQIFGSRVSLGRNGEKQQCEIFVVTIQQTFPCLQWCSRLQGLGIRDK